MQGGKAAQAHVSVERLPSRGHLMVLAEGSALPAGSSCWITASRKAKYHLGFL